MLVCVVNVSEGRRADVVAAVAAAAADDLLDVNTDAHHHRSVLTLLGEEAPRAVTSAAVDLVDLRRHRGAHPRLGAVDVVPFVPMEGSTVAAAVAARDRFVEWAATSLGLPCFAYGGGGGAPTLPDLRREAFRSRRPDAGPALPHPTAGAAAVGAREVLVAYNLWLVDPDLPLARTIAREVRGPAVRALGLAVGDAVQVSLNLVDPLSHGPAEAYDTVARRSPVARAELVGLVPAAVLASVDQRRWSQLDLGPERTIEARVRAAASRAR